jgi:hypothetical protein
MALSEERMRVLAAAATAERNAGPGTTGSGTSETGLVGMANELGMTGDEVRDHLQAMEAVGLVEPGDFGPEVTDRGRTVLEEGADAVDVSPPPASEGGSDDDEGGGLLSRLLS